MKALALLFVLLLTGATHIIAQNDYLVSTPTQKQTATNEEEKFIEDNFPLQQLCQWTPGLKFMFIPSTKDLYIPLFSSCENEKEVDSSKLKHKIFEFLGTEEKSKELSTGTNYSTRFIFESEGKKYYHEIKNQRLEEICQRNPRANIKGLVYLNDVDTAKKFLLGKNLYLQTASAQMDDANSYSGFKDIAVPQNLKVTVTAIGVGSTAYPVKIVFQDAEAHSYYVEVAFSRTNSGLDIKDFQADKKIKYFSNAFTFNDKKANKMEALKNEYIGMAIYPKKTIAVKGNVNFEGKETNTRLHLLRYTPLIIKDVNIESPKTLAILTLEDMNKRTYQVEVDLKYDFVIKNENFIEDIFAFGDVHQKYPQITAEKWKMIAQGEIQPGMNADECRLALGEPIQIEFRKDTRFETWFYNGKILEFESGILLRFK